MLSYVAASQMWLHLICGCISYVAASHMWLHLICGCISYVVVSHMWLHLICGCISYVAASHMWLHLICGCFCLLEAKQSVSLSFQTDLVGKLHINSLWPSDACNMTIHNCLKFGSDKGFLTDGMKPSPELMLAYQVFCGFH